MTYLINRWRRYNLFLDGAPAFSDSLTDGCRFFLVSRQSACDLTGYVVFVVTGVVCSQC